MIAKRTIDARAVFEQNTCAMQMNRRRASSYHVNGVRKEEEDACKTSSEKISNDEKIVTNSIRKGSLPTWLSGSSDTKTDNNVNSMENNVTVVNAEEKNGDDVKEIEKPVVSIQEEQEWEGK